MKKKTKVTLIVVSALVGALVLTASIPLIVDAVKTNNLKADYSYLRNNADYKDKVEVTGLELVTQHVSCGYASIEMISSFYGNRVTEDDLDARNSAVSTQTSKGFLDEINKSIPSHSFVKRSYLKHDVLLKEVHDAIKDNKPVALEWAAKYENEWTLHFSVVSAIDLANDKVTIYNPYGYIENIEVKEFVDRTSFKAYNNMPLFYNYAFAFGLFDKNTIFYAK